MFSFEASKKRGCTDGETTGIYIGASAGVRFVNVGADASHDADGIDASAEGCNATG